jgi:hypothetical protein
MTNQQVSGWLMSDLPDWLQDVVSIVEVKQSKGYTFYVNGEVSQDSKYIVKSLWEGRKINAVKQKI